MHNLHKSDLQQIYILLVFDKQRKYKYKIQVIKMFEQGALILFTWELIHIYSPRMNICSSNQEHFVHEKSFLAIPLIDYVFMM